MRNILFLLLFLVLITPAIADERFEFSLEEISITGEEQYDPPISLKKTGDFLVLKVMAENDSREFSQRRDEIYTTIKRMVDEASKFNHIELHSGEHPIDEDSYKIKLLQGHSRADTSSTNLYVKIALKPDDNVYKLTDELRKFVSGIKVSGRTVLFPGEVGLSIVDPEQYRYELIKLIANDVKQVIDIFGDKSAFTIDGLDQKMGIRRVSVTEVELYFHYSFTISSED